MSLRRRCAVYTRKSSEEGLEQEFNSLHAQREACEAYIRSQKHEGWVCLPAKYDDGGVSGGSLNRPALTRLLADIEAGHVDTVVVYKVDRLTRSLADFAKIVETFDAHAIAFVSVTQQFNTTTSMGRLTLNMLLSFAQFEREVTGERIRDKITASKQKGMWMGGRPPLGYDVHDKELVVNAQEAEMVRTLFRLYHEAGTVKAVLAACHRLGITTKSRRREDGTSTGGRPFTRGHLYQLLRNPLYVGEVSHKGTRYPGRHAAIIDTAAFEEVGRRLDANASPRRAETNGRAPSLLAGLVFDETGDRLCPTHANKKGRRYRYYISKRLMHRAGASADGWRIPTAELERAVLESFTALLQDEVRLLDALNLRTVAPHLLRPMLQQVTAAANQLEDRALLQRLLDRVTLGAETLRIAIRRSALRRLLGGDGRDASDQESDLIELTVPVNLKRRGVEAKLIVGAASTASPAPDHHMIALLARAHRWWDLLSSGEVASIKAIAEHSGTDPSDVGRVLQLVFLAPDIVEAFIVGRQPRDLTAKSLVRIGVLPLDWDSQRRLLGISA